MHRFCFPLHRYVKKTAKIKLEYFKIGKLFLYLHCKETQNDNDMEKELVLKTMREAGKPLAAGEVATLSGLDRKVVDKIFTELKKEGTIVSPVRCKWTPAE